ncbi:MAG: GNAT family N-acetyltransferase [Nocardioides sp.]|nr:GNAT family N-acetyltransferase [Nocardioides sp.]
MTEYAAAGEQQPHGSGLWDLDRVDVTLAGCGEVVAHLLAQRDPTTELPEGRVHCTYLWITEPGAGGPEFVGYLALRHTLTPWLLEEGGHIGYSVRPSRRRQGHASRALVLALDRAAALGLDRVLLTVDEDNAGSRAVIERAGGVYEDSRRGKRRYWIAAGRPAGNPADNPADNPAGSPVSVAGSAPRSAGRGAPA